MAGLPILKWLGMSSCDLLRPELDGQDVKKGGLEKTVDTIFNAQFFCKMFYLFVGNTNAIPNLAAAVNCRESARCKPIYGRKL
jgi:hypothetical protein